MGLAALLAGLVVIIVILGFITSLQNRSTKPGKVHKHDPQSFEDETDVEEKHSPRHHRKSSAAQHRHEHKPAQHEDATVQQQASVHHSDRPGFSESHRHHR